MRASEARRRVVIEGVAPEVDGGRFPIKRTIDEPVVVEADAFADGHDRLASLLRYRRAGDPDWTDVAMEELPNDRWRASFVPTELGRWRYTIRAWIDDFGTWARDLAKRQGAGQDVSIELLAGAEIVERTARRARGKDGAALREWAKVLRRQDQGATDAAADEDLAALVSRYPNRSLAADYGRELEVVVERERARFGAWYELFPRGTSSLPGRQGTLRDVERRLSYVSSLGFDVLYLPPIHPIGHTARKGRNNATTSDLEDPGSPWAIGSEKGGHTAIDPGLGTLKDFDHLVGATRNHGLEIALDLAYQCSPDHPWVREHPEWFRRRPDGTVQYAENPPKKYEDIYPLNFDTEAWRELWDALKDVVEFWIEHGVRIFRVDNPHTKPFAFWEWLIGGIHEEHPDVIFLSEAFTRPKIMYRLAKLGFSQSYTYFAWRNTKWELTEYFGTDLPAVKEFFRPSLWPNTPDILTEPLRSGGRPMFVTRLILAATLGANYGIYGPPFELMEREPLDPAKEEYLHSEKYEVRHWDLRREDSLAELVALVNRIRRENVALHDNRTLRFHRIENDQLLAYSKMTSGGADIVLVVVNLDPFHRQAGWVEIPLTDFGLAEHQPFQVHDLLTDARYLWEGPHNYVELDPQRVPAHVFRVRPRIRTETDFEYYG